MPMRFYFVLSLILCLSACSKKEEQQDLGPLAKLTVEVVDSIMVDEFHTLVIDDYSAENGYFLMRGLRSRIPYLVDEKGTIVQTFQVAEDGPNGVGTNGAFGYRFLGKDRMVAQGLYNGYHIYGLDGKKIKVVPHNHAGLFTITVDYYLASFHPFYKAGVPYIVGREPNLYDHSSAKPKEIGAEFYNIAKTLYRYNLDTEENEPLETYPDGWEPKASGIFVGDSYPLVAYHADKHEMAVLPLMGNQLFVYDFSGDAPELKHTILLSHKNRPARAPEVQFTEEDAFSEYPSFRDLRYMGDRILVGFTTKIPGDIVRQLRAKSENYGNLPEYKEAAERYIQHFYMVVEGNRQIGVLDDFLVPGALDFADSEGYLYVNDNVDPKIERDYNVFYKLRIR